MKPHKYKSSNHVKNYLLDIKNTAFIHIYKCFICFEPTAECFLAIFCQKEKQGLHYVTFFYCLEIKKIVSVEK